MNLYIGSHVSYLKDTGLLGSVKEALSYNSNTFMFYTGSNQSTVRFEINKELTNEAHILMEENNIDKNNVLVHAPYIINLANNLDERKYEFYINFLREEIFRTKELGFNKMVLHPGSHVTLSKETGLNNIANGLNKALININDFDLMLEFMSGKGTELGTSIDDFVYIFNLIENKYKVSICLDTCHLNDSGIDLNKFNEFLDEFDKKIGINKIHAIHINDSLNSISSHKDRHANIGYGMVGFNTLLNVIYNERLKDIPRILETPYINSKPPYKEEIENIRNKTFKDFINL